MDSKVTVFELQSDCSLEQREVPLTFPRVSKSRLYIVTNQNTQLHLLNDSVGSPRTEEGGGDVQEKSIFQHGVSTKVFAITDATATEWEIRLLLSPSEISRLSSNFNLTGFVSGCLTVEKYQDSFSSLWVPHPKPEADVPELCMAAAQFLSCSEEDTVNDYCKKLNRIWIEKVGPFCVGQQKMENMVVGAIMALVAAELATSVGGTTSFDYSLEKAKTQEDQIEQIQEMIKVFDVMADLLTLSHQGKRVQIIFRNPCPDNWASGGKKLVKSGETFVFGLCHKLVSICESECEIRFVQNLQESYDLIVVFHLPAFVEHLLMTCEWRSKIELFLTEQAQRKEIIREWSSLAVRFICSKMCHQETFLKEFQNQMLEKWLNVEAFLVGDEVVCSFGILVAILAAVTVKSNVDRCIPDCEELEDPEKPPAELIGTFTSATPKSNDCGGSSSNTLDEGNGSYENITNITNEYGGALIDLGSSPEDWVKIECKLGEVGIEGTESKICRTNDPETTNQGSFSGSLKSEELLAEPPGVTTPPSVGAGDHAHGSNPTIPESKEGSHSQDRDGRPSLDDSKGNGTCRVAQPPSDGGRDSVHESSPSSREAEGARHSEGSSCSPNLDQSIDDRAYKVAQPPIVGAQDNAHESSPTSPAAKGNRLSQGSPSLDDTKDDGACRAARPPNARARETALEFSRNSIFYTCFLGLVCLLVVVVLANVLPQSMTIISVFVAILLGLLVLSWKP